MLERGVQRKIRKIKKKSFFPRPLSVSNQQHVGLLAEDQGALIPQHLLVGLGPTARPPVIGDIAGWHIPDHREPAGPHKEPIGKLQHMALQRNRTS